MGGGELALALISGGLAFVIADFADRYWATYDPSATTLPTDKFTSPGSTLGNAMNVASPPGVMRLAVGAGIPVVLGLGAYVVRNPMGRSALQGATIGAGIKLFQSLWNGYLIPALLKPAPGADTTKSIGMRTYPSEMAVALSTAPAAGATTPDHGLAGAPQTPPQLPSAATDPGPFALAEEPAPQRQPAQQPAAASPAPARSKVIWGKFEREAAA